MNLSFFIAVSFLAGCGAAAASQDLASTKVVPASPALRGTRALDVDDDNITIAELEELARQVQIGNDIEGLREQGYFGYSVAISTDGSIVAVGGINETDSGSVRVFKLGCGNSWDQIGAIIAENDYERFGTAIALASNGKEQGSVLAITYRERSSSGFFPTNAVRVYQANGGGEWALRGEIKEVRSFVSFSNNIALSSAGTVLAVGDVVHRSALIYTWDGSSYSLSANITGGGGFFGASVDIDRSGTVLAVGALARRTPGYVKVFESNSGTWTERATITSEDSDSGLFGLRVQLSSSDDCIWNSNTPGSILALSKPLGDPSTISIYEWDGSTYNTAGEIKGNDNDNVGLGIFMSLASTGSLEGSVIAAGSINTTQIYEYSSGSWTQRGNDIIKEPTDDIFSGYASVALSLDGNTLAIGLPDEDLDAATGTLVDAGVAQVYDVSPTCFGGVFSWLRNSIAKGLRSWFV